MIWSRLPSNIVIHHRLFESDSIQLYQKVSSQQQADNKEEGQIPSKPAANATFYENECRKDIAII